MSEPVFTRLRGVFAMLAMSQDWRRYFDASSEGALRSFTAAIFAAPLIWLAIAGQNHVYLALAPDPEAARPVGFLQGAVVYVAMWVYFPLMARVFTRVFRVEESFAPWLAVHNWTVLAMLILQGTMSTLALTGVLPPTAYAQLGATYFMIVIYAHARAAIGALDAPWPVALGGACLGVVLWLLVQVLIVYAFDGAALQP